MQRRGRQAVPEADGHGGDVGPLLLVDGLRARRLGQLHGGRIHEAERAKERLLPRPADVERHARRADVGGFHDHVRDRQPRPVIVEVADAEAPLPQRALRVDHRPGIGQAKLERLGDGEDLEGRAEFVEPLHRAVEERIVAAVALREHLGAVVRVEVRQARHRQDLAGMGVHDDRGGAFGAHQLHARIEHALQRRLNRQVDGQAQRRALPRGIGQILVEDRLDARHALDLGRAHVLLAVAGAAEDVAGELAVGIDPHLALSEEQAGLAQIVHLLLLLGRDVSLEPEELGARGEAPGPGGGVHVGGRCGRALRRRPSGPPSDAAARRARWR